MLPALRVRCSYKKALRRLDVAIIFVGAQVLGDVVFGKGGFLEFVVSRGIVDANYRDRRVVIGGEAIGSGVQIMASPKLESIEPPELSIGCDFVEDSKPVLIRNFGTCDTFPAMKRWKDFSIFGEGNAIGDRVVPIEIYENNSDDDVEGMSRYADEASVINIESKVSLTAAIKIKYTPRRSTKAVRERICTLGQFSKEFLLPSVENDRRVASSGDVNHVKVGYCAQHELLDQVVELGKDCMSKSEIEEVINGGHVTVSNAWIGTKGTVTPLHWDSYENLFVQLVGYKKIRLFEKDQTKFLYVVSKTKGSGAGAQGNMSMVDVEDRNNNNETKFPDFAKAKGHQVVLGPGDALYIPQGCWHHVRSMTTSASVNYWF